ncbi:MAG: ribosome silencing factor [Bacillota bacterium]|nr:ribosome silencing factor [Bacillota bacterium]
MTAFTAEQLLDKIVEISQEKKARELVSLKLSGLTLIADYFVIMSTGSNRQAQAVSDHIYEGLKESGVQALRVEGYQEGQWILLDYGTVVVHIFQDEERAFYDLERLWGDAERKDY